MCRLGSGQKNRHGIALSERRVRAPRVALSNTAAIRPSHLDTIAAAAIISAARRGRVHPQVIFSRVTALRRSVKVFKADGKIAKMHPSAGEGANWWRRLNKALGTTSSDFVNASLFQIQAACRSPWGGISELAMNAALAMIEAAAPKDEIEGALVVQMACTHTAAMAVLAKLDVAFATERRVAAFGSAAARLMRAYPTQVEVLRRWRNGGQQFVRVEHVHVNDGGQAVTGNVKEDAKV
jgi:hypothetical protein